MKRLLLGAAIPFACAIAAPAYAASKPGPTTTSFNNPVYTCSTNRYVDPVNGSNGNSGLSTGSAWATVQYANDAVPSAGWCINLMPGTYSSTQVTINHGGNASTATGHVVYRSTTLNGAKLEASGATSHMLYLPSGTNYVMFDGIEVDGSCNGTNCSGGVSQNCIDAAGSHHLWVTNSTIHDCGQSGIQFNNSEWYWILHNEVYSNSYNSLALGISGSGISVYEPQALAGYTPTVLDGATYHIRIHWNIAHDNHASQGTCGSNSDGNGIILDDWMNQQIAGTNYTGNGSVFFNTTYHNGGRGIAAFYTTNFTISNNTAYNNNWDPCNSGTYRGEISADTTNTGRIKGNIAWTVPGAGYLAANSPFLGLNSSGGTANVWDDNIAWGYGGTGWVTTNIASPDTFATPANSRNTDPLLVDAPNNDFRLQAGSPARGFFAGADAGACDYTLTVCD